jgi:hypothetical protein
MAIAKLSCLRSISFTPPAPPPQLNNLTIAIGADAQVLHHAGLCPPLLTLVTYALSPQKLVFNVFALCKVLHPVQWQQVRPLLFASRINHHPPRPPPPPPFSKVLL